MLYETNNECFSFVRWYRYFHSVKEECSIQFGFASLNRTFNISPYENIYTIALIICILILNSNSIHHVHN